MKLKHNIRYAAKTAFTIFFSGLVFFAAAFFYLSTKTTTQQIETDIKDYSIPYAAVIEERGLLCSFPDGSAALVYLDFPAEQIYIALVDKPSGAAQYYGYPVDFEIDLSFELIREIIDRVGGINLNLGDAPLRYTGAQVIEYLSETPADNALKKEILSEIFGGISQNGFSREAFVYIIENSNSNLTVPDCFNWHEHISDMALRVVFVN